MDPDTGEAPGAAPYTHRGTRAVLRMVEFAPSTGGLALWAHHRDVPAVPDEALVATDGYTIYYSPLFERLGLAEQAGLVAHEVLHVALRHPQRLAGLQRLLGDVDAQLFNLCADAIVSSALAHLTWLSLPKGAVLLGPLLSRALGLEQDPERALLEWDVERLYRAIDDRRHQWQGERDSQQRRGGGSGAGQQGEGSDGEGEGERRQEARREDGPRAAKARALAAGSPADLLPAPGAALLPEEEEEQAREWSERLSRAHAGDGAHSLLRTLLADLPRSRTPWEQVLRTLLAHGLAPRRGVSWSRPSRSYLANQGRAGPHRRMPWEPGTSAVDRVPRLVVLVDVSGSIDRALVARFAREVEAIARRLEAGLTLIVGDDRVRRVEQFAPGEADLGGLSVEGGGGTDFTPLLEEAELHRPDLAVFLTDLDGPARKRPRWPVIWAVPEAGALLAAPFGRKVLLY